MVVLLKKSLEKRAAINEDSFAKYIIRSTENTTVNGSMVERKFSWYKRILGLF